MSDRTPGPWVENKDEQHYLPHEPIRIGWVDEGEFHEVCQMADVPEDAANAAAIVRWENNHDALVSALENATAFMEGVMQERGDSGVSILIKDARSILAKVKS